jgi:hypothetical protein
LSTDENTDSSPDLASDPIDELSSDLGYTRGTSTVAAGSWDMMTITVAATSTVGAGSHLILFDTASVLADSNFDPVSFSNLTSGYTVTVITPEPSALGLLAASAVLLNRRRNPVRAS